MLSYSKSDEEVKAEKALEQTVTAQEKAIKRERKAYLKEQIREYNDKVLDTQQQLRFRRNSSSRVDKPLPPTKLPTL